MTEGICEACGGAGWKQELVGYLQGQPQYSLRPCIVCNPNHVVQYTDNVTHPPRCPYCGNEVIPKE